MQHAEEKAREQLSGKTTTFFFKRKTDKKRMSSQQEEDFKPEAGTVHQQNK